MNRVGSIYPKMRRSMTTAYFTVSAGIVGGRLRLKMVYSKKAVQVYEALLDRRLLSISVLGCRTPRCLWNG